MDNVPGAPLPPEPTLSLMEVSLVFAAFGALCVVAGVIVLYLERKSRK